MTLCCACGGFRTGFTPAPCLPTSVRPAPPPHPAPALPFSLESLVLILLCVAALPLPLAVLSRHPSIAACAGRGGGTAAAWRAPLPPPLLGVHGLRAWMPPVAPSSEPGGDRSRAALRDERGVAAVVVHALALYALLRFSGAPASPLPASPNPALHHHALCV